MLNHYLDLTTRKALVIKKVSLELETDLDIVVEADEFYLQICTQELAAEGFLDDKDVKFKRKQVFKMTTSGKVEVSNVYTWWCGKTLVIPTSKYWIQFQTIGQAGAMTINVVFDAVMGFIDETTWNKITSG